MHSNAPGRHPGHKMRGPSLKTRPRNLRLPWLPQSVQADQLTNVDRPAQIDARGVPAWKKNKGRLLMGFFWLFRKKTKTERLMRSRVCRSVPEVALYADQLFEVDRVVVDPQPNQDRHAFEASFWTRKRRSARTTAGFSVGASFRRPYLRVQPAKGTQRCATN